MKAKPLTFLLTLTFLFLLSGSSVVFATHFSPDNLGLREMLKYDFINKKIKPFLAQPVNPNMTCKEISDTFVFALASGAAQHNASYRTKKKIFDVFIKILGPQKRWCLMLRTGLFGTKEIHDELSHIHRGSGKEFREKHPLKRYLFEPQKEKRDIEESKKQFPRSRGAGCPEGCGVLDGWAIRGCTAACIKIAPCDEKCLTQKRKMRGREQWKRQEIEEGIRKDAERKQKLRDREYNRLHPPPCPPGWYDEGEHYGGETSGICASIVPGWSHCTVGEGCERVIRERECVARTGSRYC
jgi:hypothetical protein